jgi:hypothetical protein
MRIAVLAEREVVDGIDPAERKLFRNCGAILEAAAAQLHSKFLSGLKLSLSIRLDFEPSVVPS